MVETKSRDVFISKETQVTIGQKKEWQIETLLISTRVLVTDSPD